MEPDHCVNLLALSFALTKSLSGMVHEPGLNFFSHFERRKTTSQIYPNSEFFIPALLALFAGGGDLNIGEIGFILVAKDPRWIL